MGTTEYPRREEEEEEFSPRRGVREGREGMREVSKLRVLLILLLKFR